VSAYKTLLLIGGQTSQGLGHCEKVKGQGHINLMVETLMEYQGTMSVYKILLLIVAEN